MAHGRGTVSFVEREEDHAQPAPAEEAMPVLSRSQSSSSATHMADPDMPGQAGIAAMQQGHAGTVARHDSARIQGADEETGSNGDAANADSASTSAAAVQPNAYPAPDWDPSQPHATQHNKPVQQAQSAQQAQQAAFEMQQGQSLEAPQAQRTHVRPQQGRPPSGRGQAVYAAKDYSPLEKYEAALAKAYADSFVAGAIMQHVLPAAANTVVSEQHRTALADLRRRNTEMKQLHLEEVKVERAAWQKHEEDIHL